MPKFTVVRTRCVKVWEKATFVIEVEDAADVETKCEDVESADLHFETIESDVMDVEDKVVGVVETVPGYTSRGAKLLQAVTARQRAKAGE